MNTTKTSIKILLSVISITGFSLSSALAKGDGDQNWAEKAAKSYEKKAAIAAAEGNENNAKIYKRMAQIKRDAGFAAKEGKKFSWKEYHELAGKLSRKGGQKNHHKKDAKKGGGFEQTAKEYDIKSAMAKKLGNIADAEIYSKLASIKRIAAAGKLDNWNEYQKLSSQLSSHGKHKGKHDKNKGHKGKNKQGNGFLKAAADYQAKANKAMEDGNEHNANIYTQLSNMKKEAAANAAKGKSYDWTQYFATQKKLK